MKQKGFTLYMSSQRRLGSYLRIEDSSLRWSDKTGFTLIELSIVLVIIGLIVGGVLVGQDLVRAAQLRAVVSDVEQFKTAMNTFRLKYNCLAGDCPNATTFFSGTANGDGDRLVEYGSGYTTPGETLRFWQHLSLAGLIEQNMTGVLSGGELYGGINVPSASINSDSAYSFYNRNPGATYGRVGHTFEFATCSGYRYSTEVVCPSPVMIALDAKSIDDKIDDGTADGGNVYGVNGSTTVQVQGCAGDWSAASGTYDLTSSVIACRLFFWHDY